MSEQKMRSTVWLEPEGERTALRVTFREDHVHVSMPKDLVIEDEESQKLWATIKGLCERHEVCRVLVEGYVPAGDRDTGSVIGAGMRTSVIPDLWLAFCFKDFEPTEQTELYETIAARSGTHIKFFNDPEKALQWLRVKTKDR